MMKNICFHGGHSLYEIGTQNDVEIFFYFINKYCINFDSNEKNLINRLYFSYVKKNDLASTAIIINKIEEVFKKINTIVARNNMQLIYIENNSKLNFDSTFLSNVFLVFFKNFYLAMNSCLSFSETFNIYAPVKIIISDIPYCMIESNRPLEDYDNINGLPFWQR